MQALNGKSKLRLAGSIFLGGEMGRFWALQLSWIFFGDTLIILPQRGAALEADGVNTIDDFDCILLLDPALVHCTCLLGAVLFT